MVLQVVRFVKDQPRPRQVNQRVEIARDDVVVDDNPTRELAAWRRVRANDVDHISRARREDLASPVAFHRRWRDNQPRPLRGGLSECDD
jgi:hypothetical protein